MNLYDCAVPDEKNQTNNYGETYSSSNAVAPDPEERAVLSYCLGERSCDTVCTYSDHQRKNKT